MSRKTFIAAVVCCCAFSVIAEVKQIGFMTQGISHSTYDNMTSVLESADFHCEIHEFWDFTTATADTFDSLDIFIVPNASYLTTPDAIRDHFGPIIRPWVESGGLLIVFYRVGICFINDVSLSRIGDYSSFDSTLYIADAGHPVASGVDPSFLGTGNCCITDDCPDYTPILTNHAEIRVNSGFEELVSGCVVFLGWDYTFRSENQDSIFTNAIRYWSMVSEGPICRSVFPHDGSWVSSDTAIVLDFFDSDGLDAATASVIVNGVTYSVLDPELTISGDSLIFEPTTSWVDGDTITFELVGIEDALGHESPDSGLSVTYYIDKATPFITYREPDSAVVFTETPTGALIRFADAGCGIDSIGWSLNIEGVDVDPSGAGVYLEGDSTVILDFASAGISITSGDTAFISLSLWDAPDVGAANTVELSWWFLVATGIADVATPDNFAISAYPNPFNSAVTISFDGIGAIHELPLCVEIFDLAGRRVARLPSPSVPLPGGEGGNSFSLWEKVAEGRMRAEYIWQPDAAIGSGVYLVRATFPQQTTSAACTKRVVYLK
ncbi:hypothetical protein KAH81_03825 [bacterium]|nr:hypothetical protein [bacterium]